MLPRMWLNRIFSFNDFRCQFLSLWITAWRQAPLEIWNLGTILYLPLFPSIPTKTHSASMCHKWTQRVHLFFSFFWSGLLFNETTDPSSGERRKKRGLHFTFWKVWKPHLPERLGKAHHNHRRFTKGFEKEKVAKIMFSFISWNLHEGWDEWFHYHSTHQQQETP